MTTKQKIEVMQAWADGKEVQMSPKNRYKWEVMLQNGRDLTWNWEQYDYVLITKERELTREEITAQWVRDNDLKEGDHVKNECNVVLMYFGVQGDRVLLGHPEGSYKDYYSIEGLKKVTRNVVPFEFSDRELFKDKWVRTKGYVPEFKIVAIDSKGVVLGYSDKTCHKTYEDMIMRFEFIDGKPFGKEAWE